MHLADTSLPVNASHAGASRDWLRDAATEAVVAVCDMVVTEYLRSARAQTDYERIAGVTGQPLLRLGRAGAAT